MNTNKSYSVHLCFIWSLKLIYHRGYKCTEYFMNTLVFVRSYSFVKLNKQIWVRFWNDKLSANKTCLIHEQSLNLFEVGLSKSSKTLCNIGSGPEGWKYSKCWCNLFAQVNGPSYQRLRYYHELIHPLSSSNDEEDQQRKAKIPYRSFVNWFKTRWWWPSSS